MDIRTAPELGMKNVNAYKPLKQGPNVENPARLPGHDMTNRQREREDKVASAILARDAQDLFKVQGAHVDARA